MNGPEHYAEAERLLVEGAGLARKGKPGAGELVSAAGRDVRERAALKFQEAAVHAELARVALTYDVVPDPVLHEEEWEHITR